MLEFEFECEPQVIFDLLCDPDFVVERSVALGDLESRCEVYEEGEETVVVSDRKIERDLPAFLRKVFDPVQHMEMTERWRSDDEGGWRCEQAVLIHGVPLTISAVIELFPTQDGCCYRIDQAAKARVPLIGGQLEKFAVSQAQDGIRDDMRYLENYLE